MAQLNKYHFYASIVTGQAFVFKNLIDLLSTNIRGDGHFKLTKDGIYVCSNDSRMTTLISAEFPRDCFDVYKCNEERYIGANLTNLQNAMKTVKRKERMALYIAKVDEEDTKKDYLGIEISPLKHEPMEHQKILKFNIRVYNVTKTEYNVDCPYHHPIVIRSNNYQSVCKTLNNIGKITKITMQDSRWIDFFADGEKIIDANLIFGDQDAPPENKELEKTPPYSKEFETSRLNAIIKLTSMTSQIQISAPKLEGYPLRFRIRAGSLGTVTVYLKDKEQIQLEAEANRQKRNIVGVRNNGLKK